MSSIKSITVYRYSALLPQDVAAADQSLRFKVRHTQFDANNNELLNVEYDSDENEREKFEHEYNEEGKPVKTLHYYEGELAETSEYFYENGLLVKEHLIYTDGSTSITSYEYGPDKLLLKKELRDAEGELEALETYKHENGNKVEELKYDSDNELIEANFFKYVKAGDKDRILESIEREGDKVVRTLNSYSPEGNYLSSNTYNANDQLIARHSVVEDEKKRVIEAVSEAAKEKVVRRFEYDERDNMLGEERYRNGTLLFKMQQGFNENNHMVMQSVSDGQGYFTDIYEYEYL